MFFRIAAIAIPFIWFGLLMGISFMEAPLKFQAPGITLGLGLGIGRLVFWTLNKMEIVLCLLMIASIFKVRPGRTAVLSFAMVAILLVLETVWLLPVLDVRAQQVIEGTAAPYSGMHVVYIVFDAIKAILLLTLGVVITKSSLTTHEDRH